MIGATSLIFIVKESYSP